MLEGIRNRLAQAISTKAKMDTRSISLVSNLPSNIPVYSDMSIRKATREGYKMSVYVYRAVRTIIQAASGIPWIVLDKNGEIIPDHDFTKVWSKPNKEFSGQDNMEFIIAHLKLVGNSLLMPVMVNGLPREFWVCMPDLIKPVPSETMGEWLKGWQVTDRDGREQTLPPEKFIHFMQVDPGNPYWGIGDLIAAARTVDTDNEAQDTQKISMQNRGLVDGVFTHEAPLNEEQFKEAQRQVRERYLDKSRRREPWVLGAGAKWNQMSLTPVEMDFIASRLANLRAIAAAFGLDPWWLGDRSASTYNNVMEARKALYEDTIVPLLDDIQFTLNLKVAPMYGDIIIVYDLSGIPALREDFGKKITQAQTLWNMAVPFEQINSKLELGFEEFPGWGRSWLPFNMMPVDSILNAGAPKSANKALNLVTEEQKATHWKRIDTRRVAWWRVVSNKVQPLYDAEGEAVIKAIKDKESSALVTEANNAIDNQRGDWEKTLTAITMALIEDFGNQAAQDFGSHPKSLKETKQWVFSDAVRAWIVKYCADAITSILDTSKAAVKDIILSGVIQNLNTVEIAKNLRQFYDDQSKWKSMRVARTEVGAAAGYGQHSAAEQSGVVTSHQWVSSRDDRVRDLHQEVDGETVPLDEPYSNGLSFPGDPNGDPSEIINCRCVEAFLA
jgi:HK97 family phage portal protein